MDDELEGHDPADVEYDTEGDPALPPWLSSVQAAEAVRNLGFFANSIAKGLQATADALRDARNRNRILEAENDDLRALLGIEAADRLAILRRARAANTELGAALRDLQAGK